MPKPRYHNPDSLLIGITFLLIAFGLIMLSSAGVVVGFERFGQGNYFINRQLIFFAVGLIAFFLFYRIDYHVWRRYAVPMLVGSIILLFFVFVPGLGFSAGGARRWIDVGGFLIQPAEIVKLTFLLYLAVWLEKRQKGLKDLAYGFLPFVSLLGVIAILVLLQPDLGSVSIIVLLSLMTYFVAGAPWRYVFTFIFGGLGLVALLVKVAPYRAARLTVFLNPSADPQGIGYHINQALLAIGNGGLFGRGLGNSLQKYNYLPEVTGDSIFAVIAEELGFILVVGLIALYLTFLSRGIAIARNAPDDFGKYVAIGIAGGIVVQALINMAALSGLLPLTGITLPFVSSGGSSLILTMAEVGLLANISRQTRT